MTPASKSVVLFSASFTNAATATGTVDTRGFSHARVVLIGGAVNAATNKPNVLKLTEGSVTTSMSNVSGAVGGTDFTVANADTSDPKVAVAMSVDLRGRERHLGLDVSPQTTQILTAIVELTRAVESPTVLARSGADVLVEI